MIIERRRQLPIKQIVDIDGAEFKVNHKELKDFLVHCSSFMNINAPGFEAMIHSISDNIIDCENAEMTIEELKIQLKFLRELNFFLKSIVV